MTDINTNINNTNNIIVNHEQEQEQEYITIEDFVEQTEKQPLYQWHIISPTCIALQHIGECNKQDNKTLIHVLDEFVCSDNICRILIHLLTNDELIQNEIYDVLSVIYTECVEDTTHAITNKITLKTKIKTETETLCTTESENIHESIYDCELYFEDKNNNKIKYDMTKCSHDNLIDIMIELMFV